MSEATMAPAVTVEEFEALTPAEQRVAVAKDALLQQSTGRFRPGDMWLTVTTAGDEFCTIDRDVLTTKPLASCYGCALGGALHSLIRLGNRFEFDEADGGLDIEDFHDRLCEVFPRDQMRLIECAYEKGTGYFEAVDLVDDGLDADAAIEFGERFLTQRARFTAIMQNIIDNGGEFIP